MVDLSNLNFDWISMQTYYSPITYVMYSCVFHCKQPQLSLCPSLKRSGQLVKQMVQ